MKLLHTEIQIDAPAARVWDILADFGTYGEWNPFIPRLDGKPEAGAQLTVRLEPPGGAAMTFKPVVLTADSGRELRWLGHLGWPGIFDGEHRFTVESLGETSARLVQEERFTGILVPLFAKSLETNTRRGFDAMNAALKRRAEAHP